MHSVRYCRNKYLTVPVFGQELVVVVSVRAPPGHGGVGRSSRGVTRAKGSPGAAEGTSSSMATHAFDARMPRISAGRKAAPGWRWGNKVWYETLTLTAAKRVLLNTAQGRVSILEFLLPKSKALLKKPGAACRPEPRAPSLGVRDIPDPWSGSCCSSPCSVQLRTNTESKAPAALTSLTAPHNAEGQQVGSPP